MSWKDQQRDKKGRFKPKQGEINQTGYTIKEIREAFIAGYNAHSGFMSLSQKLDKFLRGVR